jgi:hypothetical protein
MERPPLMLVEWLDSAQPVSGWHFLESPPELEIVECVSVGWLVGQTEQVVMLAPNIGASESGDAQASGFIRIPRMAVTRMVEMEEVAAH